MFMMAYKRNYYLSSHRGTKEMDFILGRFFEASFESFQDDEKDVYEKFLQEDDVLLYNWIMNINQDVPIVYQLMVQKIKDFHGIVPNGF